MQDDDILRAIRQYRDEVAARFDYDLERLAAYFHEQPILKGWPVATCEPRRALPVQPATKSLRKVEKPAAPTAS